MNVEKTIEKLLSSAEKICRAYESLATPEHQGVRQLGIEFSEEFKLVASMVPELVQHGFEIDTNIIVVEKPQEIKEYRKHGYVGQCSIFLLRDERSLLLMHRFYTFNPRIEGQTRNLKELSDFLDMTTLDQRFKKITFRSPEDEERLCNESHNFFNEWWGRADMSRYF